MKKNMSTMKSAANTKLNKKSVMNS